jgi:hypothetical protein
MANSGLEIEPNFIPIFWISQTGLDRGYSQYITALRKPNCSV